MVGTWPERQRMQLVVGFGLVALLGGLAAWNAALALLAGVVVLLAALTRRRPEYIVYGLTLILPLTGGLARGAIVPLLRVSQALVVLGFLLVIVARPSRLGKSRLTFIDLAFALYVLAGSVFPIMALYYRGDTLDFLATDATYGVSPLQNLLGPIQYYLLYRAVVATITSDEQIKVVLKLTFLSSIVVCIIGILQKMGVGPVRTFLETYYPVPAGVYDTPDISLRITSTLQHFSGVAAYTCFIILIALICYTARHSLKISLPLLVITILLNSIALVLSGTLAAWIALPVSAAIALLVMRKMPRIALFSPIGILLAIIIFQPFFADRLDQQVGAGATTGFLPQSLALRVRIWMELSLPAISQNLIFGTGPVPFSDAYGPAEESQYIHLLLEGGLPYFLSYLLLMVLTITNCRYHLQRKGEDAGRLVAIALIAIVVALNIMNVTGLYFTYVGGTQIFWMMLAIVVANRQIHTLSNT
jgi:hypothetical protein